jgi:hypothetical protein
MVAPDRGQTSAGRRQGRVVIDPTRTFLGCQMGSKKKSSKSAAKRPLASFLASLRLNLTNMAVTMTTSAIVYYGLVVARKLT